MSCIKILEPLKEILSSSKRKKLSDILNKVFETSTNMQMGVNISFENFLNQLNLDFPSYIDSLCNKLINPPLFFKKHVKDIRTNAYAIKVISLWEVNIDIQFILDLYVAPSYYTTYFTKINRTITNEFQTIIKKIENGNVDTNLKVGKLGNVF